MSLGRVQTSWQKSRIFPGQICWMNVTLVAVQDQSPKLSTMYPASLIVLEAPLVALLTQGKHASRSWNARNAKVKPLLKTTIKTDADCICLAPSDHFDTHMSIICQHMSHTASDLKLTFCQSSASLLQVFAFLSTKASHRFPRSQELNCWETSGIFGLPEHSGTTWNDMERHGTTWNDMERHGTTNRLWGHNCSCEDPPWEDHCLELAHRPQSHWSF